MRNIVAAILLLLSFGKPYCQTERGRLEIAFNPSSLLYNEARINISMEKKTSKNTSFSFSLGYGNQTTYQLFLATNGANSDENNFQFYELRPEFRYYPPFFTIPIYLSCELFASQLRKTKHQDAFKTANSGLKINYERADFTKEKYGLNIIGGLKPYILNGNYYVEMFGGMGIAYRKSTFKNVIGSQEEHEIWSIFDFGEHREGSKIIPNFTLGFRIGYTIKK